MDAIDIIKKVRKERKYTQLDFANVLGIKQNTYSDIENKRIQLKADDLIKLCCFLGLTFDVFVEGSIKTIVLSKTEIDAIKSLAEKIEWYSMAKEK